jgi:hypothetical protein
MTSSLTNPTLNSRTRSHTHSHITHNSHTQSHARPHNCPGVGTDANFIRNCTWICAVSHIRTRYDVSHPLVSRSLHREGVRCCTVYVVRVAIFTARIQVRFLMKFSSRGVMVAANSTINQIDDVDFGRGLGVWLFCILHHEGCWDANSRRRGWRSPLNLTINQWKRNNKEPRPRNNKTHPQEWVFHCQNVQKGEETVCWRLHKWHVWVKKATLTAVQWMSVVVGDSSHSFASAPNAAINHQRGIEYDCLNRLWSRDWEEGQGWC